MKKKIGYALIVTLIIIIAIVSMIFLFKQNMEINQKGSQSVSNKIIKYISQLLTRINQRYITVKG